MLFKFIPGEVEYFELRTRVFSSGLSPVVSLGWLVGALYVWALFELKRRGLIVWQQVEWPLADSWDPALRGSGELAQRMRLLIGRAFPGGRRLAIATAVLGAVALWGIGAGVQPIGETPAYARVFFSLLLLLAALAGLSFLRFWRIWRLLRTLLRRLEQTPFLPLFPALSLEIAWKPMHSFSWRMPGFNPLVLSVRRLETLARGPEVAGGPPLPERAARPLPPEVPELLSDSLVAGGSPRQQVRSRHELERLVHEAGVDLASRRGRGDAEIDTFLALRVIAYVRYVFFHLRSCLSGGLFPVLLLLFAISSYAFEPKSFFSFALLGALLLAVAVTLGVFLAMDRNPALSRIGGNEVGEITLDRTFFLNVLTYGVLPLLGLLATQVPAAGQLTHDWIKPMLRIIGIG